MKDDEWIEVFATCYLFMCLCGHSGLIPSSTCKAMVSANGTVKLPK